MESFFHTLKTELVMHCDYKTRDQARASLFEGASGSSSRGTESIRHFQVRFIFT